MHSAETNNDPTSIQKNGRWESSGLRPTRQRQVIYEVLLQRQDHPTAEELFLQAKRTMPDISLATVYNCLEAMVKHGLIKQVNLDRSATRYCLHPREHLHFFCEVCHGVYDLEMSPSTAEGIAGATVPLGYTVSHFEVSIRGVCPQCVERQTDFRPTTDTPGAPPRVPSPKHPVLA